MSGDKLTAAINLLAEYAAANLPTGYEVVLVFRSDEWWVEMQHDDDGDTEVLSSGQSPFAEACCRANECDVKRGGNR